jgi:hypothetical protein
MRQPARKQLRTGNRSAGDEIRVFEALGVFKRRDDRRCCPGDLRSALLGHAETVAAGYGEGFLAPWLTQWIDKIGL